MLYDTGLFDEGLYDGEEGEVEPEPEPEEPVVPPPPPTQSQITDAISGRYGAVSYQYRMLWLGSDLALLGDISAALEDGEIELDNKRQVVRSANFQINPAELPALFNRITDYVKVQITMLEPVTTQEVIFSQGVYRLDAPHKIFTSSGERWNVDAADISVRLLETNLGQSETMPDGYNYVTQIEDDLDLIGLPHEIPPVTYTAPLPFVWPWQTYRATKVTDLTDAINYFPVWADSNGTIRSRERIIPGMEAVNVIYTIEAEPRMIEEPWEEEYNLGGSFFNRAVVLVKDPAREEPVVAARNIDPLSDISTVTHGIEKTKEFTSDRVPDSTVMANIAIYELHDADAETQRATLTTFPDPRRDAHETYEITVTGAQDHAHWRVVGWRLPLRNGQPMTHVLELARTLETELEAIV